MRHRTCYCLLTAEFFEELAESWMFFWHTCQ
jgi:hypothetical protein